MSKRNAARANTKPANWQPRYLPAPPKRDPEFDDFLPANCIPAIVLEAIAPGPVCAFLVEWFDPATGLSDFDALTYTDDFTTPPLGPAVQAYARQDLAELISQHTRRRRKVVRIVALLRMPFSLDEKLRTGKIKITDPLEYFRALPSPLL